MKQIGIVGAAALSTALAASAAQAEMVAPEAVKVGEYGVVEASLTGGAGDADSGRKIFYNKKLGNCLACHANTDLKDQQWHGNVGPEMDGVADRYNEAELRGIIVNSKAVFGEQTVMPAFYRTDHAPRARKEFEGKPILTAEQVEDVIAYLKTLKEN